MEEIIAAETSPKYPNEFLINGERITDSLSIAHELNNYFIHTGPSLANSTPSVSKKPTDYNSESNTLSLFLTPFTPSGANSNIMKLKKSLLSI